MLNLVANGPSGYNLTRSLRFRRSANGYLSRTPASASNRTTWTWSGWIKRGALGLSEPIFSSTATNNDNGWFTIKFETADTIGVEVYSGNVLITTQVFRDPSAWYHIVLAVDTTQATSTNRLKLYVNGSQVTAFSTASYPSQNFNYAINSAQSHSIGSFQPYASDNLDGYLTEVNFIDGQALTPSSFGSTNSLTGVWQPAKYTGTYGTNGFYLPFTDNSALTTSSNVGLGKDFSGNTNYWTTNNISITSGTTYDSMTDVPTLTSATAANFCVMNPLSVVSPTTISGGNLNVETGSSGGGGAFGTIAIPSSGKYYFEYTMTSASATIADNGRVGLLQSSGVDILYLSNGNKRVDGTGSSYGATWQTNDTIGIAIDVDGSSVTFYKNGTSQGAISYTVSTKTMFPYTEDGSGTITISSAFNFGQRPFAYTPPTGYVALNTYNLPTPTILKGNKYMDATLYTGTGSSLSVTNAGAFKPDFVWGKKRSAVGDNILIDSVVGGNPPERYLSSNTTNGTTANADVITSLNSNGFTVGTSGALNASTATYVGWQWQAGQGSTSSGTGTGGITSVTMSVNASAGFSVQTFTIGTITTAGTITHGLGVAPKFIITKARTGTVGWSTYHASLGNTQYVQLNTTAAAATLSTAWNNTSPDSTVWTVGSAFSGLGTYVAYCWAEIAGFSKAFSYTGNGSTDGPFCYMGFLPKYILIKRTDTTANWIVMDTSRGLYNASYYYLLPNLSDADSGPIAVDFLSNGFKMRLSNAPFNASGGTYIGMAFAENPFKNSLAR